MRRLTVIVWFQEGDPVRPSKFVVNSARFEEASVPLLFKQAEDFIAARQLELAPLYGTLLIPHTSYLFSALDRVE